MSLLAWTGGDDTVLDEGPGLATILLRIALAAVIIWLIYRFVLTRRAEFTIRVRNGRVDYWGKVPLNARASLDEFLTRDLGLAGDVRIMGNRLRGRLELWFQGPLTPGQKQRIRNFFMTRF